MQKCSYKKSFWKYAPAVQEDNHAPVHCNFIEIKPQVFCKRDANCNNILLKEHLWGGATFEKCCNHNQPQRHFSTLENII